MTFAEQEVTLLLGGPEKLGTSLREPRAEREDNLALSEPPALVLSCFCCFDQSGRLSLSVPEVPRLDHLLPSRLRQLTGPVVVTAVITAVVVVEHRMLSADDGMRRCCGTGRVAWVTLSRAFLVVLSDV